VLGLGEAGNWPGAAKTVAEWFPIRERAFGMAIFNSGAAIGSVVAPPLIVWLSLELRLADDVHRHRLAGFSLVVALASFLSDPGTPSTG
jgi:MFS family permease